MFLLPDQNKETTAALPVAKTYTRSAVGSEWRMTGFSSHSTLPGKSSPIRFNHAFVKIPILGDVIALFAARKFDRRAARAAILQKAIVYVLLVARGQAFTFDHERPCIQSPVCI
ncbi:hypothetical protein FF124_04720 [Martelella lutilitoris]|uniref:Uncharacterized protein n=1 Tax=Martelella lutilitoris TaxID=2583532 RepID=A0A5C4JV39_9HYPH|nr:hypothetical protein [Martelella lutilitoris]TNB49293.1 hypothetical protein FF124_04720 [Martelella lutilitoris]